MKEEEVLKDQTLEDEWNRSVQTFLYLWGKPMECLRLCVLECTYYFLMAMGLTFKWLHFISQLFYFIYCDQVSDESHFIKKKTTQEKAATVHAHKKKKNSNETRRGDFSSTLTLLYLLNLTRSLEAFPSSSTA